MLARSYTYFQNEKNKIKEKGINLKEETFS